MKTIAALLVLLPLSAACGPETPRRVLYSDFSLVIASPHDVDKACQLPGGKWDDGRPIRWDEHSGGCWKPLQREIWLRWDDLGAEALPHELCHKDGLRDCEDYNWP